MHPSKVGRVLASDAALQPVIEKALRIGALSRLCQGFLPPELAALTRVANFKDGQLAILAATPSAAAKLKLLSESLVNYLLQQGAKVNSVSVRVQPGAASVAHDGARRRGALAPAAIDSLQALYRRLRDSPARAALKTLLDHQVQRKSAETTAARSARAAEDPRRPPEPRRRARR